MPCVSEQQADQSQELGLKHRGERSEEGSCWPL